MARAYGKGFMRGLLHASTRASPDETSGNNDICNARTGSLRPAQDWEACTGLGLIDGAQLLATLPGQQPAAPPAAAIPFARRAKA
jgi:hypothetical protein